MMLRGIQDCFGGIIPNKRGNLSLNCACDIAFIKKTNCSDDNDDERRDRKHGVESESCSETGRFVFGPLVECLFQESNRSGIHKNLTFWWILSHCGQLRFEWFG